MSEAVRRRQEAPERAAVQRRPGARGPRPSFGREDVLAVACRLPRDRLTMSAIGAELGVSPASIYRHFPDKEAVLQALLSDARKLLAPPSRRLSWQRWLSEAARIELAFWRAHPEFQSVARRFLLADVAEEWMASGTAAMTRAGLTEDDALQAMATIGLSTSAVAMVEESWAAERARPSAAVPGPPPEEPDFEGLLQDVVALVVDGLELRLRRGCRTPA